MTAAMVSLTDALIEAMLAESSISAIVDTRIEPAFLPNAAAFPALVVTKISSRSAAPSHDGPGSSRSRVQVDAWARDYRDAVALDLAVFAWLVPQAIASGPEPIRRRTALGVEFEAEANTTSDEEYERDTQLYRCAREYFIWAGAPTAPA